MTSSLATHLDNHDISVVVDMLPSNLDGRKLPTPGRTWACRLKIGDRFFEAKLFGDAPHFNPGKRTEAKVKFLNWSLASDFAVPNALFEIWETRRVATWRIKG